MLKVNNKGNFGKDREKWIMTYKGSPVRLYEDFIAETLPDRREYDDIFNVLKEKPHQPKILYLSKLSSKN